MPFSRIFQAWKSQHFYFRTFQGLYETRRRYSNRCILRWCRVDHVTATFMCTRSLNHCLFQDLCLFPGFSRPRNLNILISGLSRVCTKPVEGIAIVVSYAGAESTTSPLPSRAPGPSTIVYHSKLR